MYLEVKESKNEMYKAQLEKQNIISEAKTNELQLK